MKKDCSSEQINANIKPENALIRVYELTVEIDREQGQISTLYDEIEKKTRANLDRIKDLRYSVKQKKKELKELVLEA